MQIAVVGISGKVGKEFLQKLSPICHTLLLGIASENSPFLGKPLSFLDPTTPFSSPISSLKEADFSNLDAVIDFSNRKALPLLLEKAVFFQTPVVIGTTGLLEEDFALMKAFSEKIPVLYSQNFSLGILLIQKFLSLYQDFFEKAFIDINETHEFSKKDLPSGTSLLLASLFSKKETLLTTPLKRTPKDLVISSHRTYSSFGSHSISLDFLGENLTLTHTSKNRKLYAIGALQAAEFLKNKTNGYYSFQDVLTQDLQLATN